MKKAKKKKKLQYMTLMIVKGNEKSIKSLRFPKILTRILLGLLLIFLVYTSAITYSTTTLSDTYRTKLEDIKNLEETNKNQQQEIENLNSITAEVREKLKSLEELEAKVKKLVGIKD